MPGQRHQAGRTVSVTAPITPVRGFSAPVRGPSPVRTDAWRRRRRGDAASEGVCAGQRHGPRLGATGCKTVGSAYVGSNPTPATPARTTPDLWLFGRGLSLSPSRPCSQVPLEATVCRWSRDIRGMDFADLAAETRRRLRRRWPGVSAGLWPWEAPPGARRATVASLADQAGLLGHAGPTLGRPSSLGCPVSCPRAPRRGPPVANLVTAARRTTGCRSHCRGALL